MRPKPRLHAAPANPASMEELLSAARGAPVATLLLVAMVSTSVLGLSSVPALIERNLLRPYWLAHDRAYHTLVTSGFIHADLAHLFFNGFTFWAFGFGLERTIGSARFAALYTVGLLASSAGTWWRHRHEPDYRSLGASGAILAVLFASIVYFPRAGIYILPIPVAIPAPLFAVAYLGYTVYASRSGRARINHDAHLSGALTGVAFVALTDAAAITRALHALLG